MVFLLFYLGLNFCPLLWNILSVINGVKSLVLMMGRWPYGAFYLKWAQTFLICIILFTRVEKYWDFSAAASNGTTTADSLRWRHSKLSRETNNTKTYPSGICGGKAEPSGTCGGRAEPSGICLGNWAKLDVLGTFSTYIFFHQTLSCLKNYIFALSVINISITK